MPLNKLENFIKNYEGRILYVNSNDLDATDSVTNQGNSLTKPFKTIQRALIEAARFSFVVGDNNDYNARTTILVFPGEHVIDNRPGYGIRKTGTATAEAVAPNGNVTSPAADQFTLTLESNFDLTQEDNILYKFNSVNGGVIIPRGTSLVGLDLRKTKIRPKYVPNPTDSNVPNSSIFNITGLCYFWQFSIFDALETENVYTDNRIFSSGSGNLAKPTFSHHKLTVFEYADGVNVPVGYNETDLDMYYAKLSQAFNEGSGRQIPAAQKFPLAPDAFTKERAEWEIVGAFAADPIAISSIISGDSATPSSTISVVTTEDHGLTVGTPIKIRGVNVADYNISTVVASVTGSNSFTYTLPYVRNNLPANPGGSATVTIETDTVKGASPYIFNCSMRSVWGMNGMTADGKKASGFRSMVVAQYTAVSLQKDDRAFVKYDPVTRTYSGIPIAKVTGALLSSGSASTDNDRIYHLDQNAVYRDGWRSNHITIRNDAIVQIVSVFAIGFNRHFVLESGGDASITNSNSNFGQIALAADGFKKETFSKDDRGYITNIITPKAVPNVERNVDWIPIDVGLTTSVGISSHLYLFGFNSEDNVPPNLVAGYRVGARSDDRIYLDLPNGAGTKSVKILMSDNVLGSGVTTIEGTTSAVKEYTVSQTTFAPSYDTLSLSTDHTLQNGEEVIILSDDGDLPENVVENRSYYLITTPVSNQIKLASSLTNARNGNSLTMYGGTNLRILSRVSDRDSGEPGSPVQYDPNNNNWFLHVEPLNELYDSLNSLGVVGFQEPRTDVTYFKRVADDRSLDEKIYKFRVVIPKEAPNSKDPQEGFVIQESSSTAAVNDSEFGLNSITINNYDYKRNNRFISTCSESSGTVTVITELPHDLNIGDRVLIKNVKSSTNLTGFGVTGFNGDFTVTGISDDKTFTYSTVDYDGLTHNVGIFSGSTSRDTSLPRFERNDLQSNLYVYRSEVISPYQYNVQDGIYHLYVLNSSNAVSSEFTSTKYSQNIVDLYPQLDRDNHEENPRAAKTFAKRSPLGDVATNNLKNSITRETVDIAVKKFGLAPTVSSVTPISSGIATVTTTLAHGFNGIVGFTTLTKGSGYNDGTYYNVKLLNSDNSWSGATGKVVVVGTAVTSVTIQASGSGYNSGQVLKIDGFSGATIGITSSNLSSPKDNSLQVTGLGTATDGLFRVLRVPSSTQIAIAKTSGDPTINAGQYVFNVAPSSEVSSRVYNATVGITTLTCSVAHGLVVGNKFRVLDSSNNNLGDFLVNQIIGINTITVSGEVSASVSRILKFGFSANNLTSDADGENLGSRGVSFFDNETATLLQNITTDSTSGISTFSISVNAGSASGGVGVGTTARFELGSFIQIDNEIMRVASSTLTGAGSNQIVAIRGYLGTQKEPHALNSLIKKVKPIPIEFRRPSIARASGHTFEYLGYGPGNYSTALPQIQNKTLSEKEDFLAQSQETSAGQVIYTGMNSDGDFFIGNTKYSASSGEQTTFDIPIATVTGQDPSRLSVVFDEVIVKERILVEGGKSKQILSQFDGPVTFNENLIFNDETKVNGELILSNLLRQNNVTESVSQTTGSIITKGGVGIAKNLYVGGNVSVAGTATFNGDVAFNSGLVPDTFEGAYIGSSTLPWGSAWIGGIGIATEGVPGGIEDKDRTINAWTGDLILTSQVGIVSVTDKLEVTDDLLVKGNTYLTGIATVATGLVPDTDEGAYLGTALLPFSEAHIDEIRVGVSSDHEIDTATGNLILDSTAGTVIVDDKLVVTGTTNLQGTVTLSDVITVNVGIVPDTDEGAYLGTALLPFSEGHFGEIRIAVTDDNTIDTATGNLILDSAGGLLDVNDNVDISGTLNVESAATFQNDVTINADNKFFKIQTNSSVDKFTVDTDNGDTAIAGTLTVTGLADFNGAAHIDNLRLGTDADNEITTSSGDLVLDSASGTVNITDNADIDGDLNVDGNTTLNGNTTVGNASSDTLTVTATSEFNATVDVDADFAVRSGTTDKFIVASSTGNTTIKGTLQVDGAVNMDTSLEVDNVTINGNTVSTNTGNLVLDSTGGIIDINDNVDISGTLLVSSTSTLNGNTAIDGALTVTGDITAFYSSDLNLKNNVTPIENSLSKILGLSGNTYEWNEKSDKEGTDIGVIAQEVQALGLPGLVTTRDNGYLAVRYEKLVPLLIEAIKELNAKVDDLEQKLSDK